MLQVETFGAMAKTEKIAFILEQVPSLSLSLFTMYDVRLNLSLSLMYDGRLKHV